MDTTTSQSTPPRWLGYQFLDAVQPEEDVPDVAGGGLLSLSNKKRKARDYPDQFVDDDENNDLSRPVDNNRHQYRAFKAITQSTSQATPCNEEQILTLGELRTQELMDPGNVPTAAVLANPATVPGAPNPTPHLNVRSPSAHVGALTPSHPRLASSRVSIMARQAEIPAKEAREHLKLPSELSKLQQYADHVARISGLYAKYNSLVFPSKEDHELTRDILKEIDRVKTLVHVPEIVAAYERLESELVDPADSFKLASEKQTWWNEREARRQAAKDALEDEMSVDIRNLDRETELLQQFNEEAAAARQALFGHQPRGGVNDFATGQELREPDGHATRIAGEHFMAEDESDDDWNVLAH
jgi:hypothetical protein